MEKREQILSDYHVLGKLNEHGLTSMVKTAMADYAHSLQPTPAQEQTPKYTHQAKDKLGRQNNGEWMDCVEPKQLSDRYEFRLKVQEQEGEGSPLKRALTDFLIKKSNKMDMNLFKNAHEIADDFIEEYEIKPSPVSRTGMSLQEVQVEFKDILTKHIGANVIFEFSGGMIVHKELNANQILSAMNEAAELYASQQQTGEWIRCKDKLPVPNQFVMILVEGDIILDVFRFVPDSLTGNGFDAFRCKHTLDYILSDVTHWMPLPTPPNQ